MVVMCASRAFAIPFYILISDMLVAGAAGAAQCAVLADHSTFITTDVEVGTPGQWFSVIVDTGSNALTVPSCECVKLGFCDNESRCFEGNRSSSFVVQPGPYGVPPSIKMVFGSGPVFASVTSELVQVGGIPANMQDSLYLITGHALDIESQFEGILGMGLPFAYQLPNTGSDGHQIFVSSSEPRTATPPDFLGMQVTSHASLIQRARGVNSQVVIGSASANATGVEIHGFAEKAGVQRVAICLKNEAPGVMNFQPPPAALSHGSVGRLHWGLDFRGVSVGNASVPVAFCTDQEIGGTRTSPCGAMVDTGSTSIRAPGKHIGTLYQQICDAWPRCAANYTAVMAQADPNMLKNPQMTKGLVFKELLFECKAWWVQGVGLDELPKLYFNVRGAGGTSQSLELHGWSYVVEQVAVPEESEEGQETSSAPQTECVPAFRPIEYNTDANGPVWVFGMPLFYEYQVSFDHASWPPGLSFDDVECSPCQEPSAVSVTQSRGRTEQGHETQRPSDSQLFSASSSSRHATVLGGRRPRRVIGKFREPYVDVTKPL
mmetsp:Transcript_60200/g.105515  ORF Transcript_60200/g.105515 Transcript_60200/m.105515 type:complete len:547 (-) Transcript_60200:52-1692(-)